MTDYPNREHANKDKAARAAAIEALASIMRDAQALGRQLANPHARMVPYAADAQPLHHAARVVSEKLAILETLRDVREWHEADQSGAESVSQAAVAGDAQPYSGPRYCLFCGSRARWDLSGFLSCSSSVHLGRARDALAARREQEDSAEEGVAAELRQSDAS